MGLRIRLEDRGFGRAYLLLEAHVPSGWYLETRAQLPNDELVPTAIYPAPKRDAHVLVVPCMAGDLRLVVRLVDDQGRVVEEIKRTIGAEAPLPQEAPATSQFAASGLDDIRYVDLNPTASAPWLELSQVIANDDGTDVVHANLACLAPQGANLGQVGLVILDLEGKRVDIGSYQVLSKTSEPLPGGHVLWRYQLSWHVPTVLDAFVAWVHFSGHKVQDGFVVVEPWLMGKLRGEWRDITHADSNKGNYHQWFLENGRASDRTLHLQAQTSVENGPTFSIIVPVFETPLDYLAECIDSVRAQTYSRWELILVNASPAAGSTASPTATSSSANASEASHEGTSSKGAEENPLLQAGASLVGTVLGTLFSPSASSSQSKETDSPHKANTTSSTKADASFPAVILPRPSAGAGVPDPKEQLAEALAKAAASDERIRVVTLEGNRGIALNTRAGIEAATGDYLCFLDHDDFVEPNALFEYAAVIQKHPEVDLLYCDEDLWLEGKYQSGYFKPDFTLDLLLNQNYVTHWLCVSRSALERVKENYGLPGSELDGAQDYALTLGVAATGGHLWHVRKFLYHWRAHPGSTSVSHEAKTWTDDAGRRALENYLSQRSIAARVKPGIEQNIYQVDYEVPTSELISVVVLRTRDDETVYDCVRSVVAKSSYPELEVLVVNPFEPLDDERLAAVGEDVREANAAARNASPQVESDSGQRRHRTTAQAPSESTAQTLNGLERETAEAAQVLGGIGGEAVHALESGASAAAENKLAHEAEQAWGDVAKSAPARALEHAAAQALENGLQNAEAREFGITTARGSGDASSDVATSVANSPLHRRAGFPSESAETRVPTQTATEDRATDGALSRVLVREVAVEPGLGVATQKNRGAALAQGTYLLFLDDCCLVGATRSWIELLLGPLQRPEVALTGAGLAYEDGLVRHCGICLPEGAPRFVNHGVPVSSEDADYYRRMPRFTRGVSAVSGSAMLVKAQAFRDLGGFDEGYRYGLDDVDLCLRARKAKDEVVVVPRAELTWRGPCVNGRVLPFSYIGQPASPRSLDACVAIKHDEGLFRQRWSRFWGDGDPFYNPQLAKESCHYQLTRW